jgi:hypothetical protein
MGVIEPLTFLHKEGLISFHYKDSHLVTANDIKQAHILIAIRSSETVDLNLMHLARQKNKYIIYYLDDDLLNVSHLTTPNGNYLNTPAIQNNITLAMKLAHCLWTSNTFIAEKYQHCFERVVMSHAPAILLDGEEPSTTTDPHPITIGYAGGIDNRDYFERILLKPFQVLLKRYPKRIRYEIIGFLPNLLSALPIVSYPFIKDYDAYKSFMHTRHWDIGLAPLPMTPFHACKYFNKYIEYGSIGAAGIYSNVSPYTKVVKDKENGLLCENKASPWAHKLIQLIEEPTLRNNIIENAHTDLKSHFNLEKISYDIYQTVIIPLLKEY